MKNIKTKLTAKGIDTCCIDDDSPKRSKKLEEREGGVLYMECSEKEKAMVRHTDMKACVLEGKKGPNIYPWRIDCIKQSGNDAHKMTTRKQKKHTFDLSNHSRYMREDYHSLAYGHKDAHPLIPMEEVIEHYHRRKQQVKNEQGD